MSLKAADAIMVLLQAQQKWKHSNSSIFASF